MSATVVSQSFDNLWNQQDGNDVLLSLRRLREELLRREMSPEDPSEAFLAIQGAALRFRPPPRTGTGGNQAAMDEATIRLRWSIAEEALGLATVLSCTCVGPAWRYQIHERRLLVAQRKVHRDWRQPGPRTIASEVRFPQIPEILPGAMLRFAASILPLLVHETSDSDMAKKETRHWQERKANIAISQRYLVLALCSQTPLISQEVGYPALQAEGSLNEFQYGPRETTWNLPGVVEIMEEMVLFWLSLATGPKPSKDWSCTCQVTSAIADLTSLGWRPRPEHKAGALVVQYLLDITEVEMDFPEILHDASPSRPKEAYRSRYYQAVLNAIRALAQLANRGSITVQLQQKVMFRALRLNVALEGSKNLMCGISPFGFNKANTNHMTGNSKTPLWVQLDALSSESADLVWALLNSDCSNTTAMQTLFEVIKSPNLFSKTRSGDEKGKMEHVLRGVAIRMASSSLWRRGSMNCRDNSERTLKIIREVSQTVHSKIIKQQVESELEDTSTYEMLTLALDTVISLGIFADRQFNDVENSTSGNEWGFFILAVKEAFLAWQDYSKMRIKPIPSRSADVMSRLLDRAQLEIISLLLRIGACLDRFVQMERSPFHTIVTNENQKELYLFILRIAVIAIPSADAELLGLSAFRAWMKFLSQPTNVANRIAEIVTEGFSKYSDGTYVHSAKIRESCLITLSKGIVENRLISLQENGSTHGQSVMHVMNIRSSASIDDVVIPILKSILVEDFPGPKDEIVLPESRKTPVNVESAAPLNGDEFASIRREQSSSFSLESLAVSLVGDLVRDNASTKHARYALLDSLILVALSPRQRPEEVFEGKRLQQDSIQLRAVVELHSCLMAPFGNLPLIYDILPKIVDSLRAILVTKIEMNPVHQPGSHVSQTTLAMASLVALCRLRPIVRGTRLSAVPFSRLEKLLPQSVQPSLLKPKRHLDIQVVRVARFIQLTDVNDGKIENSVHKDRVNSTFLDFELVIKGLTAALDVSRTSRDSLSIDVRLLLQSIGSICFHALTEITLSGFSPCNNEVLDDIIFASGIACTESVHEICTKSQMLAALTECAVADQAQTNNGEKSNAARGTYTDSLLNLILYVCDSSRLTESVIGCRAVLAILPSLISIDSFQGTRRVADVFTRISKRLRRELMALRRRQPRNMLPLIDEVTILMSIQHELLISTTTVLEDILGFFDLCKEILEVVIPLPPSLCLHLTLRCLVASIQRLPQVSLKQLCNNSSNLILHNVNQPDVTSTIGQPKVTKEFVEQMLIECVKNCLNDAPIEAEIAVDHERMALEIDRIERFQVEKHKGSEHEMKGVWLCDDAVLISIRIGTSRYKGWVELVRRSPSSRKRVMIQLPATFSIANPDQISMIWSKNLVGVTKYDDEIYPKSTSKLNLARYENLTKRFDDLLSPSTQEEGDKPPLSGSPQQVHAHVLAGTANTEFGRRVKNDDESILGWLEKHLRSEDCVEKVRRSIIEELNISEELITFDKSVRSKTEMDLSSIQQLEAGRQLDRAMAILDRTNPASTHKIGILYAGPLVEDSKKNLDPEAFLISVRSCSPSFIRFTEGLGDLVPTRQLRYFSGGLDVSENESDGRYGRVWIRNQNACIAASKSIVVYHILHLMRTGLNNRKRHVGNDNVLVIFLETDPSVGVDVDYSEERLRESIVSGHFGFATIFVSLGSIRGNLAKVTVLIREGLQDDSLGNFAGTNVVAKTHVAHFVRSLALRIDLACRSVVDNLAPPSNCSERYRMIKQLKRYTLSANQTRG